MNIPNIVTTELLGQINAKHAPHYYAFSTNSLIPTKFDSWNCEIIKIQQTQPETTNYLPHTIIQLLINNHTITIYDLSLKLYESLGKEKGEIDYTPVRYSHTPYTIHDLADPQSMPKTLQLIDHILCNTILRPYHE